MTARGPNVRAAALSVISNSVLILLKVIAASITGSVAILTEEQPSEQVDPRRDRDRQRHARIAVIALKREDQDGHKARQNDAEPGDAGKIHRGYSGRGPDATLAVAAEVSIDDGR